MQNDASSKQADRVELMGELLRSKGFLWLATSNLFIGGWQQAGNILKIALIGRYRPRFFDHIGHQTLMHLLERSTFALNNVIIRLT